MSNIIRVAADRMIPLTDSMLLDAYEWAVDQECGVTELLQDETADALASYLKVQLAAQ